MLDRSVVSPVTWLSAICTPVTVTALTRPLASVVRIGTTFADPYVPEVPTVINVGLGYVPVRSPPAAPVGVPDNAG